MRGRTEYLLACLVEECAEVQKDAIKAMRFGLNDHSPTTGITNRAALRGEFLDLLTLASMLRDEGVELYNFASNSDMAHMRRKEEKVEKYLSYSQETGAYSD